MKFTRKLLSCLLAAVMVITLSAATAFAEKGTIDWNKGVIRVTGIGAGKAAFQKKQPGVYRAQAKRAALMDAQRNLAETVSGVRVTSESTMEDMILQSDVVRTRVDALIKGMSEVSSQYFEDGTYEVVLEMRLFGSHDSLAEAAFIPFKEEPKAAFPPPVNVTIVNQPNIVNNSYTGLVVDCRGMNLIPMMSPVVMNDKEQTIYGHRNIDIEKVIRDGVVSYANDVNDESSRSRAGNNPLVVKAVRLYDDSSAIVSIDDADKILAANQYSKFLDKCAVVFVR